jgi:hypothetical protein
VESQVHGAEELSELPGLVCIAAHQSRLAARLSIVNPDGLPGGTGPGASKRVGAARSDADYGPDGAVAVGAWAVPRRTTPAVS